MPMTAAIAPTQERVSVAGCPVDRLSFEETVAQLNGRIESGTRTHVLFVNAAKIVRYHQDAALRTAMDRADLLLADGVPVVWASRLLGRALPGRVNGTDLMERMVAVSAERGYRVFFLGARQQVISKTVDEFVRRHPDLKVAGFHNGYFQDDEEAVIKEINAADADLLLVGMSTPQKELWVDRNLAQLRVCVAQGVGGSFDVIAGLVPRAPRWMQRCGLEWFHRFLQEPARLWHRYLVTNSVFLWFVFQGFVRNARASQ